MIFRKKPAWVKELLEQGMSDALEGRERRHVVQISFYDPDELPRHQRLVYEKGYDKGVRKCGVKERRRRRRGVLEIIKDHPAAAIAATAVIIAAVIAAVASILF